MKASVRSKWLLQDLWIKLQLIIFRIGLRIRLTIIRIVRFFSMETELEFGAHVVGRL